MGRKPKVKIEWQEHKDVIEKYRHYVASIGHSLGKIISRELRREAESIVEMFYDEYRKPPRKYTRHTERGFEKSGYSKALYSRFYAPGGYTNTRLMTIEVGWVTDNMYDDYGYGNGDDPHLAQGGLNGKEAALESFIEGYHGSPGYGIQTKYYPQRLFDYLSTLLNESNMELMVAEAIHAANNRGIF